MASRCIPHTAGRGNLVLRHPFPIFCRIFRSIVCWVAELNAGHLPWCASKEKKIINNNSNTQPLRLNHTLVPLRHDGHKYTFFILINVQSIEPFSCGHNIGKFSLTSESAVAAHCLRSVYIRDENYSHFHVIIIFWKYT